MASQEAVYIIPGGNPIKMPYTPDKTRNGFPTVQYELH
jgi:hypothetical protein